MRQLRSRAGAPVRNHLPRRKTLRSISSLAAVRRISSVLPDTCPPAVHRPKTARLQGFWPRGGFTGAGRPFDHRSRTTSLGFFSIHRSWFQESALLLPREGMRREDLSRHRPGRPGKCGAPSSPSGPMGLSAFGRPRRPPSGSGFEVAPCPRSSQVPPLRGRGLDGDRGWRVPAARPDPAPRGWVRWTGTVGNGDR